mgnify:CR=1 FL=1
MRRPLRKTDLLGRYGGEEFLILLAVTDDDTAVALAERIRAAVESTPVGPDPQRRTISIGVTSVRDGDDSFDALISRADLAVYRAKAMGRNRVVVFEDAAATA